MPYSDIIDKPRYDYITNEQVEIDRLVYQMYNLNEEKEKILSACRLQIYALILWQDIYLIQKNHTSHLRL